MARLPAYADAGRDLEGRPLALWLLCGAKCIRTYLPISPNRRVGRSEDQDMKNKSSSDARLKGVATKGQTIGGIKSFMPYGKKQMKAV